MDSIVIVPTYNEAENIRLVVADLLALSTPIDVVVVDDNSPDGTGRIADELSALHPAVHALHRPGKLGLGTAYIAGFKMGLTNGYVQLRDELGRQYRQDVERFAVQTLAASSSVTNERLAALVESIDAAQAADRQWVVAALRQIELDRLRDNEQLSTAFAGFAVRTEDELERTKQGVVQLLSYGLADNSAIWALNSA